MTLVELKPGVSVEMRPPTGFDDLVALSIRAKMEEFLKDFESLAGNWSYQARFALIVACTDKATGLPFDLPAPDAEGAALAASYRAWLQLPRRMFRKLYDAVDEIEAQLNAPELTPGAPPDSPLVSGGGNS